MMGRNLGFYLHIYRKILTQDLKSKMSYRADFIISTIGMLTTNVLGFASFWILFKNFSYIKGWNYHEILFLYGFSLIALTPVQCFFDNNWYLREYVYSGDFIKYCFRPINIFFYFQSEIFDVKGIGQLLFGIATLIYSMDKMDLEFNLLIMLKLIIFLSTASIFMISIMNIAAASCFWIMGSGYIMSTVARFKDYAKYPITIFNSIFRFIFTFLIPIAFIAYYPSLVILNHGEVPLLSWLSPVIGCVFFWISYKIWMYGAMKYNGTGS